MLDSESSLRLRLLNFPLIVGVVYIHAFSATITFSGVVLGTENVGYLTEFIRIFVSQGLARLAVPLFFLMSGYFFFSGEPWSWSGYGRRLAARVRTLLLPYFFWTVLVVVIRYVGQSLPTVSGYFIGDAAPIADYSVFGLVNAVLGLVSVPEAYHMWFIRDLMVLMILSPLLYCVLRFCPLPFLGGVFVIWITANWPLYTPPDVVGILFFSAGGYLAITKRSLFSLDRYGQWCVIVYVIVLFAVVIWYDEPFNLLLHRCNIVLGIIATLFSTRLLIRSVWVQRHILWLGGASFFVYAAHEPWLGVARILAYQLLPLHWPLVMLAIYLIVPALVIGGLVVCHTILAALVPRMLGFVTGGR